MIRKIISAILALVLLFATSATGEGWDGGREIACAEDLPGCRLLQMVMAGSFDDYDPEDAVLGRVLACVYPMLGALTEADLNHFVGEFGQDADAVRVRWYGALANCLWAYLETEALPEAQLSAAQRVLLLFLEPPGDAQAEVQRAQIREQIDGDVIARIADDVAVPPGFVEWLVTGE